MKPISIWYHCLFYLGSELQLSAFEIVSEQMTQLQNSGLKDASSEMIVGCNGGNESAEICTLAFAFPKRPRLIMHGLGSRAENLTIVALHDWAKEHPAWFVLYLHAKGCTHPPGDSYGETVSKPWRQAMMQDLVLNWQQCVEGLTAGNDVVCSHWMWNMGSDRSQHIPAGNFLWTTSDFVAKLPSMFDRERIKVSGIASAESRYEAEVFWGNGPRPVVMQMRPNGGGGVP